MIITFFDISFAYNAMVLKNNKRIFHFQSYGKQSKVVNISYALLTYVKPAIIGPHTADFDACCYYIDFR